jgi:integrase
MACPTKRRGSDNWYYRKRIPADVQAILAKLPKDQRPPSWFKDHISISLKTSDRTAAKAKCPEVAAEVERTMAALRAGPKPLTDKQISALSGELYKAFAEGFEDNPILTTEQWLHVADLNEQARRGEYGAAARLGIHKSPEGRRRVSMEARFGKMTDAFLARRGVVTDNASRGKLIEWTSRDLSEAARKLSRNADGDFAPDDYAKRFQPFERASSRATGRSLTGLVEAWHKAALDRGVTKRDATRTKQRFDKLVAFLEHDDASRVTKQDIVRWRDHRLARKISVKTINDSDIASFSNVFNWGAERGWLSVNPAERATIKAKRKKAKLRDEFFTREEAAKILRRAAAVTGSKRENPKTTAAKRWVPWLCAYSGARVAEMIQLRKQDVRKDPEHGWVIRLTPEAGSIKNNRFCDVPVHKHLVATGFVEFVNSAKAGHLFCDPGQDGTITGPAGGVYSRVRELVRDVIDDTHVQPNHAWRYTFKTYGLEAGIEALTLDAISNHSPRTQGEAYTKVTLKARVTAMAKLPRYELTGATTSGTQ